VAGSWLVSALMDRLAKSEALPNEARSGQPLWSVPGVLAGSYEMRVGSAAVLHFPDAPEVLAN